MICKDQGFRETGHTEAEFYDRLDESILRRLRINAVHAPDRFLVKDIRRLTPSVIAGGDVALVARRIAHLESVGALVLCTRETEDGEAVHGWYVSRKGKKRQRATSLRITESDAKFLSQCGIAPLK